MALLMSSSTNPFSARSNCGTFSMAKSRGSDKLTIRSVNRSGMARGSPSPPCQPFSRLGRQGGEAVMS
eukprot:15476331-Alexandrium_andersonii.AAC.1